VVGTDRPRRPRDRPQRKRSSSAPHDKAGAALPCRRVARGEGRFGGAAIKRAGAAGEAPCSCRLSELRRGRAPVGAERAGAPARAEGNRPPPRSCGLAVREAGKSAAARGQQAPSVEPESSPCRSLAASPGQRNARMVSTSPLLPPKGADPGPRGFSPAKRHLTGDHDGDTMAIADPPAAGPRRAV
jgi:hypothetical protein